MHRCGAKRNLVNFIAQSIYEADILWTRSRIGCVLYKKKLISLFTRFYHCLLSSATWNHSTPWHPLCFKFILIYVLYSLEDGILSSGFPTKFVNWFISLPVPAARSLYRNLHRFVRTVNISLLSLTHSSAAHFLNPDAVSCCDYRLIIVTDQLKITVFIFSCVFVKCRLRFPVL